MNILIGGGISHHLPPPFFPEVIMIDTTSEKLIPLTQLPLRLPSAQAGKQVGMATLYRWLGRGLESVKIGGIRYTSEEALARFADQSSPPVNQERPQIPHRASSGRTADVQARLRALGLLGK